MNDTRSTRRGWLKTTAAMGCSALTGDNLSGVMRWKARSEVSRLAQQQLRLRFVMKDADVYSFRFQTERT